MEFFEFQILYIIREGLATGTKGNRTIMQTIIFNYGVLMGSEGIDFLEIIYRVCSPIAMTKRFCMCQLYTRYNDMSDSIQTCHYQMQHLSDTNS